MKKVLVHICCGICAGYSLARLKADGFKVMGFFYNPNIQPEEEYFKRLDVAARSSNISHYELIVGSYDLESWSAAVEGLEHEPEGGRRCSICYKVRLQRTFLKAQELGISHIASTLSISPHKNTQEINRIGKEIAGDSFLEYDFKKDDGFKTTMAFSKFHALERQNYCGCIFSRRTK